MPPLLTVANPYSGDTVASFAFQPWEEIAARAAVARAAFDPWRRLPVSGRVAALTPCLAYFERERESIARDITAAMGRPLADARREIDGLLERARYFLSIAADTLAPEPLPEKPGFDRAIHHDPLGVVLVVSAWNYPLLITINGVLAALLAGNTVLLKHARQTPVIGRHFAAAFHSAGGVDHLLQDLISTHQDTALLIEHRQVDHVVFTGSVEGGRAVYQSCARALIDCQLELGGKDAAYVAPDADLDQAAAQLVDGAVYNAGQSCCGVERVYAHTDIHDAFVERCLPLLQGYVLGDPLDHRTTLGPLAVASAAALLQRQVDDAVARGARLLCGGHSRRLAAGVFFEPTLLTDTDHSMEVLREENFGPVLPVMRVSSDEEALRLVNDSRYGLTSIIYTSSPERARLFFEGAETGTVFQNRCDYLDPALPWTGVKDSGLGSALSRYGLLGMTRRKARHFRTRLG